MESSCEICKRILDETKFYWNPMRSIDKATHDQYCTFLDKCTLCSKNICSNCHHYQCECECEYDEKVICQCCFPFCPDCEEKKTTKQKIYECDMYFTEICCPKDMKMCKGCFENFSNLFEN